MPEPPREGGATASAAPFVEDGSSNCTSGPAYTRVSPDDPATASVLGRRTRYAFCVRQSWRGTTVRISSVSPVRASRNPAGVRTPSTSRSTSNARSSGASPMYTASTEPSGHVDEGLDPRPVEGPVDSLEVCAGCLGKTRHLRACRGVGNKLRPRSGCARHGVGARDYSGAREITDVLGTQAGGPSRGIRLQLPENLVAACLDRPLRPERVGAGSFRYPEPADAFHGFVPLPHSELRTRRRPQNRRRAPRP